ncbi:hypothetical protein K501DRAFT_270299 [Backusella circina FSU 941]|nr:hypothetical protein K501DRAFT_270299 [Backusella circina FSU 941]
MSISNAIELKKREEAKIQDVCDKIPSPKSVHLVHVATYMRTISECHNRKKSEGKSIGNKKQLHQLQNQRTVVAYGDANFLRIKGHSPAPVKKTLQTIPKKALVILIDEYKTFITCSNVLDDLYRSEDFKREHKKRTIGLSFEALPQLFR